MGYSADKLTQCNKLKNLAVIIIIFLKSTIMILSMDWLFYGSPSAMILLLSQLPGDPQSGLRDQCQQDLSVDIQYCQGRLLSSFFIKNLLFITIVWAFLFLCWLFADLLFFWRSLCFTILLKIIFIPYSVNIFPWNTIYLFFSFSSKTFSYEVFFCVSHDVCLRYAH